MPFSNLRLVLLRRAMDRLPMMVDPCASRCNITHRRLISIFNGSVLIAATSLLHLFCPISTMKVAAALIATASTAAAFAPATFGVRCTCNLSRFRNEDEVVLDGFSGHECLSLNGCELKAPVWILSAPIYSLRAHMCVMLDPYFQPRL